MLASTELISEHFSEQFYNERKMKEIIELVKREEQLQGFIHQVEVKNKLAKYMGFYSFYNRHLIINTRGIQRSYDHFIKDNNIRFGSMASTRHYNIMALDTMLHEASHATQAKESVKPVNDSLHQIIREGMNLSLRSPYQLSPYKRVFGRFFYRDVLVERQAEFNALLSMLKRNEEADFLSERETIWITKKLINLIVKGYGKHHTPVSKYYLLRNKYLEYRQMSFDEDYSLEERLGWGLPVDYELIKTLKGELDKKEPNLKLVLKY